jgi:cation transport regulator ChaC
MKLKRKNEKRSTLHRREVNVNGHHLPSLLHCKQKQTVFYTEVILDSRAKNRF